MIFIIFIKFGVSGLHGAMQNSRHREATDMRLAPIDSLYFRVLVKIMRSQHKLGDFEKSGKLVMKRTLMSVSKK